MKLVNINLLNYDWIFFYFHAVVDTIFEKSAHYKKIELFNKWQF